jgi:mRNA interferase MazF
MVEPFEVRRGDILWIDCDPSVGVEPGKARTCVVVSNDHANAVAAAVTVIPTLKYTAERTTRPFVVDLRSPRSTLVQPRVANASMIVTYDRSRIRSRAGRVAADSMKAIDHALAVHLGLALP